ncbi:ATPase subunit of ABC transporter with duplicated ATPase domains [Friedmanniella endophytica]|uniref:ATPase subunit of ABC transporter with duplicated ATPase domains n=1 Tax=Microlunatus kandeliicorticis TaxID=1759536 RepID=A0A7W3IUV3_9ACTN|nr:ATP-binding cassette domain-containing protein [Microlunatus kandeliicorticis]MBA8795694.1 ATPase subunit of ABC transporter with duplicated ATPase domains [Microlunatus kandeliicorticis]
MPSGHSALSALAVDHLGFGWPDGQTVLHDLTLAFPSGLTGLIGANGSGKTTLLGLLTGRLTPTAGSVTRPDDLGHLPQDLVLDVRSSVADVLGIAETRRVLRRIEAGEGSPEDFDRVADQWDVEERATAQLAALGFDDLVLDRPIRTLSGGEAVLLALAALFLRGCPAILLDEPTNNLDSGARERLYAGLARWSGIAVVVSHDRDLLMRCDQIVELRDGRAATYGGNFVAYTEQVELEQAAAERMVRSAEAELHRQRRELIENQTKLARRKKVADKAYAEKRQPRIAMNALKRSAQVSAAKLTETHRGEVEHAREELAAAEERLRDEDAISVDLAASELPAGREVLRTEDLVLRNGVRADLPVRGPERLALVGPNGSGKTTLIDTLTGRLEPVAGRAELRVPWRELPQRLTLLPAERTVLEAVGALAPSADTATLRGRLARFLLGADVVTRRVATLSGGELFRATLAAVMLAEPAPQLLILDEPTNNLDLASLGQLTGALRAYPGALLVVSHDPRFLEDIGITTTVGYDVEERSFRRSD